jgi:signal transduction histidine kinase
MWQAKESAEAANREVARLNQELKHKLSEFETLIEIVPIGIALCDDPECRRIRANPALTEMLGITFGTNVSLSGPSAERPGNHRFKKNGQDLRADELPMQVAAATGRPVRHAEFDLVRDDGHVARLCGSAVPLFDETGKPRGCVAAFWDIADLKDAEERSRAAKDAAEQVNQAKDQFVAMVSHDLRAPLTAMLLWSQLLEEGKLEETQKHSALRVIRQCAETQSRLVEDLLDASRILYGKVRAEMIDLDLADVARTAVEAIRPVANTARINLQLSLAHAEVTGDPFLLGRLITNLLTNALRFTPEGGHIEVRTDRQAGAAELHVSDDGAGIGPELLAHLFEPFHQGDVSAARRHEGLGLGLSIVRHIAELHGGVVVAVSEGIGRGATFSVTLPHVIPARGA